MTAGWSHVVKKLRSKMNLGIRSGIEIRRYALRAKRDSRPRSRSALDEVGRGVAAATQALNRLIGRAVRNDRVAEDKLDFVRLWHARNETKVAKDYLY